jgi:hypothetical protein
MPLPERPCAGLPAGCKATDTEIDTSRQNNMHRCDGRRLIHCPLTHAKAAAADGGPIAVMNGHVMTLHGDEILSCPVRRGSVRLNMHTR